MAKVSVIVPNYNHAAYLKQRIDTILDQTYQDFEVIILDDCSNDNSRDIIEQYRQHRKVSQIIYNNENSGSVFKQWRKGIEFAGGDFIWIAESDDYAHKNFLKYLVPLLEENDKLGIVYSDSIIVDSKGSFELITFAEHRNKWLHTSKWNSSYTKAGIDEIKENLLQTCTINNASAVLFRKKAIVDTWPFDLSLHYIGDWYCYLKICLKYDIGFINNALNYYREHPNNSFKKSRNNLVYVSEYFLLFDWALRNLKFMKRKVILNYFQKYTRQSLIRNWSISRLKTLKYLFLLNPYLFMAMLVFNIKYPLLKKYKYK